MIEDIKILSYKKKLKSYLKSLPCERESYLNPIFKILNPILLCEFTLIEDTLVKDTNYSFEFIKRFSQLRLLSDLLDSGFYSHYKIQKKNFEEAYDLLSYYVLGQHRNYEQRKADYSVDEFLIDILNSEHFIWHDPTTSQQYKTIYELMREI